MTQEYLAGLTKESISTENFSIAEITKDSLYYPACYFDGSPVVVCNRDRQDLGINSFIYCDCFPMSEEKVRFEIDRFRGYKAVGMCLIPIEKIIPPQWEKFHMKNMWTGHDKALNCFAIWAVIERLPEYDSSHGPKRFSFTYIIAEGVAAYFGLYERFGTTPKVLSIVNPGMEPSALGATFGPFYKALSVNQVMPEYMFVLSGHPIWPEYVIENPYCGRVCISKFNERHLIDSVNEGAYEKLVRIHSQYDAHMRDVNRPSIKKLISPYYEK